MIRSQSLLAPPKLDHAFEWIWTAWLLTQLVSFSILEGTAIHRKQWTLSRFVWEISKAWPLLGVVNGIVIGVLINHFYGSIFNEGGIEVAERPYPPKSE